MHHLLSDLIKDSLIMTEKSERGRRKKEKSPAGSLDLTITRRVFYRCATTAAQLDSNYGCFESLQVVTILTRNSFLEEMRTQSTLTQLDLSFYEVCCSQSLLSLKTEHRESHPDSITHQKMTSHVVL